MPTHDTAPRLRVRLVLAAVTGIGSGAVRAITGWLLQHLTSNW
jgi:hypothetical protein